MASILDIALELGRSESFIWKLMKDFKLTPISPPIKRKGIPGLYNKEAFIAKYKWFGYDR